MPMKITQTYKTVFIFEKSYIIAINFLDLSVKQEQIPCSNL